MMKNERDVGGNYYQLTGSVIGQIMAAVSGGVVGVLAQGEIGVAIILVAATASGMFIGWWARKMSSIV